MTTITLNPFDDTYTAQAAGDVVNGMGGNDTLTASAGGNRLNGGDGDDALLGGAGNDTLTGDDTTNFSAHNILQGGAGNDVISSLSWGDEVNAGAGDDLVNSYAQRTSQVVDGGTGNDLLYVSSLINDNSPVSASFGSTFVFVIGGINGATYMNFERLQVTLGIGANTITGGAGDDVIFTAYLNGTNATTTFDAGFVRAMGGNDLVAFNGITALGTGIQRMDGGLGFDRLAWTAGDATITDLTIDATVGTMVADGRKFATFAGFEDVSFRSFDPIAGAFSYTGFKGADRIDLGATTVTIATGLGDDGVTVQHGIADVSGGAGNDVLQIAFANADAAVVHGNIGNDTLLGGSGQGDFYGDDGNDLITVNDPHSHLFGGAGNDVLSLTMYGSTTGSGPASVDGGTGTDVLTLKLFPVTTPIVLNLSQPVVTLADGTTITGVEGIILTSGQGNDDLTASNGLGGALVNQLSGMGGNDSLHANQQGALLDGGFGLDLLLGGAGNDVLQGGFGADNDVLRGGGGADTLIGNVGRDDLMGGLGADHFTLNAYFESGTLATNRDQIRDFNRAQGDKIDLSAVDAKTTVLGLDHFDFIGAAAFDSHAGQLRSERVNLAGKVHDYTLVSGDITGDGLADFTIEVKGLIILQATDFVL